MAKIGLEFYRVDTDRYLDIRIRRLKRNFGCQGLAVYDYVLCEIYRVKGCFMEWDDASAFDVAEFLDVKENTVKEIVRYCASVGLFNKELLQRGIVTSASIQRRFLTMSARAQRKYAKVPTHICLLSDEDTTADTTTAEVAPPPPSTEPASSSAETATPPPPAPKPQPHAADIRQLFHLVPEDDYWEAMRLSSWGAEGNFATQTILQWMQMQAEGTADKFYITLQALQSLEDRGQLVCQCPNRFLWRAKVVIHKAKGIFSPSQREELFHLADTAPDTFIAAVNEWQKVKTKINSPYNFIKSKFN